MTSGRWSWFVNLFEGVGVTVLVTIFGFVVLAIVGASIGYVLASIGWRIIVARKRKRRLRAMERRLEERLSKDGEA